MLSYYVFFYFDMHALKISFRDFLIYALLLKKEINNYVNVIIKDKVFLNLD